MHGIVTSRGTKSSVRGDVVGIDVREGGKMRCLVGMGYYDSGRFL